MKKNLFLIFSIAIMIAGNGFSVRAAPEFMEDGEIFDADWYKEQNPDVVAEWEFGTTEDLYQHYVRFGKYENRTAYNADAIGLTTLDIEEIEAARNMIDPNAPNTEIGNIEIINWDTDGYGIHYRMTFTVLSSIVRNIWIGDKVCTVNNESSLLEDRWARISIDDGRIYTPSYIDYYANYSESAKALLRGVSTVGAFRQEISDGIMAGQVVTIEVYQRVTSLDDRLEPQILVADIEDPRAGYSRGRIYGLVVFDDILGKAVYLDAPIFPGNQGIDELEYTVVGKKENYYKIYDF